MRTNLFIDMETLPTTDGAVIERIIAEIEAPSNYKDPEKIAAYKAEKAASVVAKTALDGSLGRIAVIGFAFNHEAPRTMTAVDHLLSNSHAKAVSPEDFREHLMLQDFFDEATLFIKDSIKEEPIHYRMIPLGMSNEVNLCNVRIIGHHIAGFDIRFITQRAIILGVRLPTWWPRDPKPWSDKVFDTMTAFSGSRDTISLDRLCRALGIEGKGDIDGSKVAGLWAAGEHKKVAEYCCEDVRKVQAIYKKMAFSFGLEF